MPTRQPRPYHCLHRSRRLVVLIAVMAMATDGCRHRSLPNVAESVPRRAGEVWELDIADSTAPAAALLAFVSGTHVLVVDGEETYAGMRVTDGGKAPDGGQPLALAADGISATLAPSGAALQLRFATGEVLSLRRRSAGDAK